MNRTGTGTGNKRLAFRLISLILVLAMIVGSMFWRFSYVGSAYTDAETNCGRTEHTHTDDCYEKKLICKLEEGPGEAGHTHTSECYEKIYNLVCGQEETAGHTHTDACYQVTPPMLICGQEETAGHTHTDACYQVTPSQLICGQEESTGHSHTEGCYNEDGELICGQEEYPGHTHTADCYSQEVTTLVCGQEEYPAHWHTEACYSEEVRTLVCGQEESEGHVHTNDCYEKEYVLTCGQEESDPVPGHTHTDECYKATKNLICTLEEHTHTEACLSNSNADVESAGVWESTLPARTGVWRDDVVAIARSQLGYTESSTNFVMSDDGRSRKGYTRYGAWFGVPYGDWCAMFASFCISYAGVPRSEFPLAAGVNMWMGTLSSMGRYAGSGSYTPLPGDLVFFNEHVGIVERVEGNTLYTIEGNTSNAVREKSYSLSEGRILGYGILPDQGITAAAATTTEEEEISSLPKFDDLATALFGTSRWRYDLHVHRYVQWTL